MNFLEICGSHRTVMLQAYDDLIDSDALLLIKLPNNI